MIPAILRVLARLGLRRALSGPGGRGWLVLGLTAASLRLLHGRADRPKAQVVEKLEPGHSLVITHFPAPPKK